MVSLSRVLQVRLMYVLDDREQEGRSQCGMSPTRVVYDWPRFIRNAPTQSVVLRNWTFDFTLVSGTTRIRHSTLHQLLVGRNRPTLSRLSFLLPVLCEVTPQRDERDRGVPANENVSPLRVKTRMSHRCR